MRLDTIVHNLPNFYQWKLGAINVIKGIIYRMFFINNLVEDQRKALHEKNQEYISTYFPGKRVLEIGCGRGSFIAGLVNNHGCSAVGIDVSNQMIEYAKANNPGPEYFVMDSSQLNFADKEFDYVIFTYVLHHVANLDETIKEAKRVSKNIVIYESCPWESEPLRTLSSFYWKTTDGGYNYLPFSEWKKRIGLPVVAELEGKGLVRYGMGIFQTEASQV